MLAEIEIRRYDNRSGATSDTNVGHFKRQIQFATVATALNMFRDFGLYGVNMFQLISIVC